MIPHFTYKKPAVRKRLSQLGMLLSTFVLLSAAVQASPFYVGASAGYSGLSGTHDHIGNVAGRLVLGVDAYKTRPIIWGVEVGAQTGGDVRLDASEEVVGPYGEPLDAQLKPLVHILLTAKTHSSREQPWNAFIKAGAALRELQLESAPSSHDSITRVAPEVQVGVGYRVSKKATITLYYQGIYAQGDAAATRNSEYLQIDHIPTQQGGFLGVEYKL